MKNKQEIGTKKKGKTQGGKFLGKGAYGCVFSPPVPCENKALNEHIKKNAKGVGKFSKIPTRLKMRWHHLINFPLLTLKDYILYL